MREKQLAQADWAEHKNLPEGKYLCRGERISSFRGATDQLYPIFHQKTIAFGRKLFRKAPEGAVGLLL